MPGMMRLIACVAGIFFLVISGCGAPAGSSRSGPPSPGERTTSGPKTRTHGGGQEKVAGVLFEPADASVRRQCRRTAATVGYPIFCPRMVPEPNFPTSFGCRPTGGAEDLVGAGCRAFRRWQVTSIDYIGERSEGHGVVQAAPHRVSYRTFIMGPGVEGEVRIRVGALRRIGRWRGRDVRVMSAPGSMLDGHTVFLWRARKRTYGVGFHGHGATARTLNAYLVRHSNLVE